MSFPLLGQSGGGSTDLSAVQTSISALQSSVAGKADSTSVYTQAEVQAISQALANAIATKQKSIGPNDLAITDTALLVSELASKALASDLTSGLAGKQIALQSFARQLSLQSSDVRNGEAACRNRSLLLTKPGDQIALQRLACKLGHQQGGIYDAQVIWPNEVLFQ